LTSLTSLLGTQFSIERLTNSLMNALIAASNPSFVTVVELMEWSAALEFDPQAAIRMLKRIK